VLLFNSVFLCRDAVATVAVAMMTVDAGGAGEGQLTVDVLHNGSPVTSHVTPGQSGRHYVNFLPDTPGLYQIRVCFAGVEINGTRGVSMSTRQSCPWVHFV